MKKDIILLDDHTINQIAAGEVIEGPDSVVKELIENSMDAGATKITVHIKDGGLSLIEVIDNGEGMDSENIRKAFMRHGTSKLGTIDDLYRLDTMGFRGEALPSIAAVSRVSVYSKGVGEVEGIFYGIHGGEEKELRIEASGEGTRIVIEDLFYNAPVRQKFLKSSLKETKKVVSMVEKLALSRPDISFEMKVDERSYFKTLGTGDLREAMGIIYSQELAADMLLIDCEVDGIRVSGLIGPYFQYRGSRGYENFFINSRYVKSKELSQAFENAYRHLIPVNKYPIGILHLTIPTYEVEVNIHPKKLEVKIENIEKISQLLTDAVRGRLYENDKKEDEVVTDPQEITLEESSHEAEEVREKSLSYVYLPPKLGKSTVKAESKEVVEEIVEETVTAGSHKEVLYEMEEEVTFEKKEEMPVKSEKTVEEQIALNHLGEVDSKNPFSDIHLLGVLSNTYIIGIREESLFLFDQHAAHERINFEKKEKLFKDIGFRTQNLIEPVSVEVSTSDYMKIIENILRLREYGVVLESFGERTFLVRGIPLGIEGGEVTKEFVLSLVDFIEEGKNEEIESYLIAKAACVASVKAHDSLNLHEMEALVKLLGECEFPYTCPHGRPTVIEQTVGDLEKLFLRV